MRAIESQSRSDSFNETAVVNYDENDGAVKMKRNGGDVRLASLPPLAEVETWMHIVHRSEFVAVLSDGRPLCVTLHF